MTQVTTAPKPRKLAGASVGIPPRQVNFSFRPETPRYFYGDNATATLFFAVLSGFFPPGERFFVESVRHYRDRISDDTLKAQVSGFIGQEAIHGREHDRLNDMLAGRGINMQVPDKTVKAALWLLEKLPASQQLACTAYMEHFTALLAEQLLTDKKFREKADPELIKLWQWHALEELEHKSVSFDVYEKVGNSQRERILALPYVALALLPAVVVSWTWLVIQDGKAGDLRDIRKGLALLLGRRGFVTRILPKMPLFHRKNYHPAKHDTKALEVEWREKLFGENGGLRDEFRNRDAVMVH